MTLEEVFSMMWGAEGLWWGWIMMVSIWAVFLVLIVWAVRNTRRRDAPRGPSEAERTLDERFASGDIDADEYEARLDVLRRRD